MPRRSVRLRLLQEPLHPGVRGAGRDSHHGDEGEKDHGPGKKHIVGGRV